MIDAHAPEKAAKALPVRFWRDALRLMFVLGCPIMELNSAANGLVYGIWLLDPLIDTYAAGKGYALLRQSVLTEPVFGTVVVVGAMLQLVSVFVGPRHYKAFTALGGLFTFSVLAASFFISNKAGGGWVFVGFLALSNILAFIRHVGDGQ